MENFSSPSLTRLRNLREKERQVHLSFVTVKEKYVLKCMLLTLVVSIPVYLPFCQGSPIQEENKKRKQQNLLLGPQAGT